MKRFAVLLFCLSSFGLALGTPSLFDTSWNDRSLFTRDLVPSQQILVDELSDAPVYHLELTLSDDLYSLSGKQELLFTNTTGRLLPDLVFRLSPNALGSQMTVSSVLVDGQQTTFTLEQGATALRIPFSLWLLPDEQAVISIDFSLEISNTVASYGRLARYNEVLSLAHGFPTLSVFRHDKWDTDYPAELGDPLVADTSFFLVRVHAPLEPQLVASGVMVDITFTETQQTVTFATGPARDFYLAAVTGYIQQSKVSGDTIIHSYVPAAYAERGEESLEQAADALALFSKLTPYPYREFDIVAVPIRASGIEYPGIINLANSLYTSADSRLETVLAHEVGHQWSFNLVGSDQISEPWLDEAMTQYLTYLYHKAFDGEPYLTSYLNFWRSRWQRSDVTIPVGLETEEYSASSYGPIVYGRGLYFFLELADLLGEDVLASALQTYYQTYAWQFVTSDDFQRILEQTCACELNDVFKMWITPALE